MKALLDKAVAAINGNEEFALRRMLAEVPELSEQPALLNHVAWLGQVGMAEMLLSAGADPDGQVPSHEFYRPLHRAIEHRGRPKNEGHRRIVELLLEAGASPEKRSTWRQIDALAVAGMEGDPEMIEVLVEWGVEMDIFTAAITADEASVRRFLRRKSAAVTKDSNNMTPLHYAALSGLGEQKPKELRKIAEMLLAAGADGNATEKIGPYPRSSVLQFAACENFPVAEVLLGQGCDPNPGFGFCLWRQPARMAELYLAHGGDVNLREASGQPILHARIHWNLPSVALWLLEKGADPNLTDAGGNTALHEAARRGINPKVVQAILERGGRKTAKNQKGETPLDLAKEKKRVKLIPLL